MIIIFKKWKKTFIHRLPMFIIYIMNSHVSILMITFNKWIKLHASITHVYTNLIETLKNPNIKEKEQFF